jgi:hypothetical protein
VVVVEVGVQVLEAVETEQLDQQVVLAEEIQELLV